MWRCRFRPFRDVFNSMMSLFERRFGLFIVISGLEREEWLDKLRSLSRLTIVFYSFSMEVGDLVYKTKLLRFKGRESLVYYLL